MIIMTNTQKITTECWQWHLHEDEQQEIGIKTFQRAKSGRGPLNRVDSVAPKSGQVWIADRVESCDMLSSLAEKKPFYFPRPFSILTSRLCALLGARHRRFICS